VPARAGVRGRERRPAQGARAVVLPGAQGQRLRRRDGAVQTEVRRPRVPLQRAGIGGSRRAAGAARGFHQEMTTRKRVTVPQIRLFLRFERHRLSF
jgi:hypothetical protein